MDNYIVSARKYRPSTFESVIGQKALTQTLKNAIQSNKLAHAYLFCGPRGVGKTTCARIFAKTINCLNPTESGDACNECESCKAFNEQRSYNIAELDAASNNSVDNIRELIAQVQIPPQIGHYKVFIVDEVHMLSTAAFNAFLKTLEEPPHHAIFILATTEKHKILPTILSRCQTYDFNRISLRDIADHLAYVANKEGIQAEPQALHIIAQKADGGMRDALSIFDQIVSFTNGNVTYQATIDNLNVLDYDYYFQLTEAILQGNVSQSLLILNDIINRGFDPQHFINGFSSHLREVMVSKDPVTLPLIEAGEDIARRYQAQGVKCSNAFLYQALQISNECDLNYKASRNKRLLVEIALIRIAQLCTTPTTINNAANNPIQPISASSNAQQNVQNVVVSNNAAKMNGNMQPNGGNMNGNTVQENGDAYKKKELTPQSNVVNEVTISSTTITPPTKTISKPGLVGKKNISIRGGVKKEEEVLEQPQRLQEMNNPVDKETLEKCWINFTKTIPQEVILVNTLLSCKPNLSSATQIEVVVDNPEQVNKIKERGATLLNYLRTELKNSHLEMHIRESEKQERKKVFSDREKYTQMVNINPDLNILKETFGLDLT